MSTGDRTLDYLTEQITRLEEQMADQINPQEFGQLQGSVRAMDSKLGKLEEEMKVLSTRVQNLIEIVTEARGGWRTVVWLGGLASTVGGAIGWALAHVNVSIK